MTSVESSHRCMLALKFSFQNATAIAREMQCYEYEDDVCALYILFQYYSSRMLKDIKCTEIECERERFGVSRARELEEKERERN